MLPNIHFCSRDEMMNFVQRNHNNARVIKKTAVISVNDNLLEQQKMDAQLGEYSHVAITINYSDSPISQQCAENIVTFINDNKDKEFIVHCLGGISRSASIALFINHHLNRNSDHLKGYTLFSNVIVDSLNAAAHRITK